MSDVVDVVFLGINDAGMRVYEWLCKQEDVFVHSLITTEQQLECIRNVQPDFIISCGYRHIIPESIIEIPTEGCLNLHSSYLPFNKGANPNVWSIIEETPAGATLHYIDKGIDTGDIVAQQKVQTQFSDTGKTLYEKLEDAQVELFKKEWKNIVDGNVTATPQDPNNGTYHRSSDFENLCHLDPEENVKIKDILNRLRALTYPPYNNAKIEIDGETYYVDVDIKKA